MQWHKRIKLRFKNLACCLRSWARGSFMIPSMMTLIQYVNHRQKQSEVYVKNMFIVTRFLTLPVLIPTCFFDSQSLHINIYAFDNMHPHLTDVSKTHNVFAGGNAKFWHRMAQYMYIAMIFAFGCDSVHLIYNMGPREIWLVHLWRFIYSIRYYKALHRRLMMSGRGSREMSP